jgi:hypothetical protein
METIEILETESGREVLLLLDRKAAQKLIRENPSTAQTQLRATIRHQCTNYEQVLDWYGSDRESYELVKSSFNSAIDALFIDRDEIAELERERQFQLNKEASLLASLKIGMMYKTKKGQVGQIEKLNDKYAYLAGKWWKPSSLTPQS